MLKPTLEGRTQAADRHLDSLHIDAGHQCSRQGRRLERMTGSLVDQRAGNAFFIGKVQFAVGRQVFECDVQQGRQAILGRIARDGFGQRGVFEVERQRGVEGFERLAE
ncbi:hypothetical protein [Pseudomonas sp. TH04]|uniref:hypothetical protein n=1 Tax=Pseudomonas sp. TH04 TaxID=2796370 RepID=UPI001F5BE8A9|nr:hypothetical protein [Pseudomonas sp. TH04]